MKKVKFYKICLECIFHAYQEGTAGSTPPLSVRICTPVITGIRMLCIEFIEDIIDFEINLRILINIVVHRCIPNKVGCCREKSISSVCRLRSHTFNNALTNQAGIKVLVVIIEADIPSAFRYIAVNIFCTLSGCINICMCIADISRELRCKLFFQLDIPTARFFITNIRILRIYITNSILGITFKSMGR